jgi:microcystin-dependent protein
LPNLLGKVVVGVDSGQVEFASVGLTGGEKAHILTAAEMPQHQHTLGTGGPSDNTSDWPSDNLSDWPNNNTTDGGSGTTNWQSDTHSNYQHYHGARIGNVGWIGNQAHGHFNHGGYASEGPEPGNYVGGAIPVNVDTVDTNHYHNTGPHNHGMANHAHAMKNHTHTMKNHTHSGTSSLVGSSGSHNNLQPYMAMYYLIKT